MCVYDNITYVESLPHTYDACDAYASTKHTHKTQHLRFRDAGHEVKRALSEAMAHVEAVAHRGACLLRASHLMRVHLCERDRLINY